MSTPESHRAHFAYRSDIDGLRAVAVASVVIYHAFPESLPGGFVGVDVFFVISGFLITTIILGSLTTDTFGFADFYARRIKRIFPALLVVLAACTAAGWLILFPDDYRQFGTHLLAAAAFASNLLLWHEAGYFDAASEFKPLLHLWSLGVEEQFYLIWPLLLVAAHRLRLRPWTLAAAVFALSFGLCAAMVRTHPIADFYSPATRAWELMLGALLACAPIRALAPTSLAATTRARAIAANGAAWLGMGILAFALLRFDKTTPFPGAWALLPTLGTALLIAAGPRAWIVQNALSRRLLVGIGRISYPIYLWHWPLLSFAHIYLGDTPSPKIRVLLALSSVALAWATWRFVESPIRFGAPRTVTASLSTAMAGTAAAAVALIASGGMPMRIDAAARRYADFTYNSGDGSRVNTCWLTDAQAPDAYVESCMDPGPRGREPLMMVWGDSHAARLFPGLNAIYRSRYRMAQYTRSSCPAFLEPTHTYEICGKANQYILGRVAEARPDVVVLFGYWALYAAPDARAIAERLKATIAKLRELGVAEIIVVGPAPRWKPSLPHDLARIRLSQHETPERTWIGVDRSTEALDADLRDRLADEKDVSYFSAFAALCDERGCLTHVDPDPNTLTTWDYGHLTTPGATFVASKLGGTGNWESIVAARYPSAAAPSAAAPTFAH